MSAISAMQADVIAKALDTPEGRKALSNAMTAPLGTPMMYQNIGRKLLLIEETPDQYPDAYNHVKEYVKRWNQKCK